MIIQILLPNENAISLTKLARPILYQALLSRLLLPRLCGELLRQDSDPWAPIPVAKHSPGIFSGVLYCSGIPRGSSAELDLFLHPGCGARLHTFRSAVSALQKNNTWVRILGLMIVS